MAKQGINTGSSPNDGTGDSLRAGASKINANFDEVYTTFGDGSTLGNAGLTQLSVTGVSTLTNKLEIRSDDGTPGRIDYYCESSNTHYTRVQSAPHAEYSENVTTILPTKSGDIIVGDVTGAISQNVNTTGIITAAQVHGDASNVTGITTLIKAGSNVTITTDAGITTIASTGGGGGGSFNIGFGATTGETPYIVGTCLLYTSDAADE